MSSVPGLVIPLALLDVGADGVDSVQSLQDHGLLGGLLSAYPRGHGRREGGGVGRVQAIRPRDQRH